jgi:hypothetical protein
MSSYYVNTTMLNVRSTPDSRSDANIVFRLQRYRIVEVAVKSRPDWWEITAPVKGFVASRFLLALAEEPEKVTQVGEVHCPGSVVEPELKRHDALPHGSLHPFPGHDLRGFQIRSAHEIVDKLDVANTRRYSRTAENTFCNVYAYDFCYFNKAYLPRVWWNDRAIKELMQGRELTVETGVTVHEMTANALHNWLMSWGDDFGWSSVKTGADDFQQLINTNGGVGVICARRRDRTRSGHITVVLPSREPPLVASRSSGKVLYPLQSQAGSVNLKYFSASQGAWWAGEKFDSFGMFYHE